MALEARTAWLITWYIDVRSGIPQTDREQMRAAVAGYDKPGQAQRVTRKLAPTSPR